jgi:hypothetical protein
MSEEALLTAPAPSAPAAKAPALANAPKVEIKVSQMTPSAEPAAPPKKGSAREEMFKNLRGRAGQEPGTEKATPTPESLESEERYEDAPEEPKKLESSETKPEAKAEPKKVKANPWKLVEEFKHKLAAAEASRLDIEKRAIPEDKWKERETELENNRKRNKELEEEIKFVNYAKSEEFKNNYQVPYEKAWSRAMSELGELTVVENGTERPLAANDILELVNLPLGKASELAKDKFGDLLASEVMAHRKEIKGLFEKQSEALEGAKKAGAERDKKMTEESQRAFGEMATSIKTTWSKANEDIIADPKVGKFFSPVEGDAEVNQRLAKGFELADRAFSENPAAPGLTAEQRATIVKRHAAVRNRAAAFGRLVYENEKYVGRIAELEKTLSEYKGSEPETKGNTPPAKKSDEGRGMAGVLADLRKRAKQV